MEEVLGKGVASACAFGFGLRGLRLYHTTPATAKERRKECTGCGCSNCGINTWAVAPVPAHGGIMLLHVLLWPQVFMLMQQQQDAQSVLQFKHGAGESDCEGEG